MNTAEDRIWAAYCPSPKCEQDTIPSDWGTCLFCDEVIVADNKALYKPVKVTRPHRYHTRESIVTDLQQLAAKLGRPPRFRDNDALARSAHNHYGSWANAVEAAGFAKPLPGRRYKAAA